MMSFYSTLRFPRAPFEVITNGAARISLGPGLNSPVDYRLLRRRVR